VKEQVLHLDLNDDYNSARDKMGWAQTARVLANPDPSVAAQVPAAFANATLAKKRKPA